MRWNEPTPGEHEARGRTWEVVRAAYEEREPVPRRRDWRPVAAAAIGVAVLAAAFSPPGLAVLGSLKDAVRGEEARDELVSLPTAGRILVQSPGGAWIVQRDGSKRFLSDYLDASWSPHGKYLAAARGNQLVALEPNGTVRWKLARAQPIGAPQWSFEGYRIAYLSGRALRIVNGDGTGDRLLSPSSAPVFAWRPRTHQLAYETVRHELILVDVDGGRVLWRRSTRGIEQLLWSADGARLFVASRPSAVVDSAGRRIATLPGAGTPAAFAPRGRALALTQSARGRTNVVVYSGPHYAGRRLVFAGAGAFEGLAWSPDGRWLLVDWRTADQWIFIRSTTVRRVISVSGIGRTFDSGPEHHATLEGWCCP